jgi:dATP/dGTP diphosphohydrolase
MNTDSQNPKDLLGATKPSLHLVPPAALIHMAKAMEFGASKYGPYNWRDKKVHMTVYIAAAMRHLMSLLDGENVAQDSGVHHGAHAAACMGIILDALECNCLVDDRPKAGCAAALIDRLTVKKSADPEPTDRYCGCGCGAPLVNGTCSLIVNP